jgi:hypothetical protein
MNAPALFAAAADASGTSKPFVRARKHADD